MQITLLQCLIHFVIASANENFPPSVYNIVDPIYFTRSSSARCVHYFTRENKPSRVSSARASLVIPLSTFADPLSSSIAIIFRNGRIRNHVSESSNASLSLSLVRRMDSGRLDRKSSTPAKTSETSGGKVHNGARTRWYTRVCSRVYIRIWPRKVERDVVSTPGCANIDRGVAVTKNSTEREYDALAVVAKDGAEPGGRATRRFHSPPLLFLTLLPL